MRVFIGFRVQGFGFGCGIGRRAMQCRAVGIKHVGLLGGGVHRIYVEA